MKHVILIIGFFAVARAATIIVPATTHLVRSPAHDSAIVQSERLGGSFAYSTLEGHAYKAYTPVVTQYELRSPLLYTSSVGPQLVYHQPVYSHAYLVTGIVGAVPEAPKPESRSDEPKSEEKKENEDSVVVESA